MTLKQKWWIYHKKNPHVYELVERFTLEIISHGFRNYSINSIFERIRWHTDVKTTGDKFKVSNNHHAYYARYFMHNNPQYKDFFRTQKINNEE